MEGDVDGTGSDAADTVTYDNMSDEDAVDDAMNEGNSSDEDRNVQHHTFDRALPVKHTYLGMNLEELRGRTLLDDDSYQTIPLLPEPGVVLVPGQTLPLTVFYPPTISMLRRTITTDHTFGVVCVRYATSHPPILADIGTTAEIYAFQDEEETAGFKIKAIGRQRFKIVETQRQIDGNVSAKVRILPEIILGDPLAGASFSSCDKYRKSAKKLKNLENREAVVTRWPSWVYSQFQTQKLMKKLIHLLRHMKIGNTNASFPTDPVELSFWVAQSVPLRDEQKLDLLRIDCAVQRLRWELSVLERCRILCCQKCSSKIAYQRDIFSMSVEGPQGTYVNSGGYVHETVTVYKAKGLRCVSDEPSTEYSWFPGYAWTITECRHCQTHMGWLFTSTQPELRPAKFWGLCRRSLAPKLETGENAEFKPVM
ncbi:Protein cereblon homolog [Gryllus bimaculatus]|nr:Protein cereblon homolog [Gryllus bimaculatus]